MRLHALTTICKQNDNYKITGAPGFPRGRLALAKNDTAKTRRLPAAIKRALNFRSRLGQRTATAARLVSIRWIAVNREIPRARERAVINRPRFIETISTHSRHIARSCTRRLQPSARRELVERIY